MIQQDTVWYYIKKDGEEPQNIAGKWMYFSKDREKIHAMLEKLDELVETNQIKEAWVARKIKGVDPWPEKPCVLLVFTSNDHTERQQVKKILKDALGISVHRWKSDAETEIDWDIPNGVLWIEQQISDLQIATKVLANDIEEGKVSKYKEAVSKIPKFKPEVEEAVKVEGTAQTQYVFLKALQIARESIEKVYNKIMKSNEIAINIDIILKNKKEEESDPVNIPECDETITLNTYKKVVYIEASGNWGKQGGTGVIIRCKDQQGKIHDIIVSCLHVVSNSSDATTSSVKVWLYDSAYVPTVAKSGTVNPARLQNVPKDASDLAIIELDESLGREGVKKYAEAHNDAPAFIYGYPLGKDRIATFGEYKVTPVRFHGRISSVTNDSILSFAHDGQSPVAGVSGAPVFNEEGALLGIWRGKYAPNPKYSEGVIIGEHWIEKICSESKYYRVIG